MPKQEQKYCAKCRKIKPITEFTPRNKAHTVYKSQCKPCYNSYHRKWLYSQRILRELGR